MTPIYDIHTHELPAVPGEAVVQLTPAGCALRPGHLYSASLHPWDIRDDWKVQMARVAVQSMHPRVVAIGEAGIDKKNSPVPVEVQMEVFREHVKLSETLGKPLIVHCVKATDEILYVRKEMNVAHPWVLHGYRGGPEQAGQLRKRGVYVSFGRHYNADALLATPSEHLLLESDIHGSVDEVYRLVCQGLEVEENSLRRVVALNMMQILHSHHESPF